MQQPHILLITSDQHRGDSLGINGHPVVSAPNLDYLAASGTNFPRAYVEGPSCIAARRTILSGQKPVTHGMVTYWDGVPWEIEHTLPGELGKAGYQTQLVGKLHMYPPRKRYGFDHVIWADSPWGENDYTNWLHENGVQSVSPGVAHGQDMNSWVARPSHLPEELEHTTWCTNEAMRFLDRRDPSAPFFLYVSYFAPHPPLTPPQFYYDRYLSLPTPEPVVGDWAEQYDGPVVGLDPNAPRGSWDPEAMHRCRAAYYGLINFVDDQVARLLQHVRKLGLLQDTFILYTSDHGEMLGDHNLFRKTFAYEGSARIPFMVNAPDWLVGKGGKASASVVGLQDVMPTLLDAAGAEIPDTVDGASLLPLMRGEDAAWRDYLHGEHLGTYRPEDAMQYLTDGKEKYIWYTVTGEEQLFNLADDPQECHNLAPDSNHQDRLMLWRKRMIQELSSRTEGYTDGKNLIPGRRPNAFQPDE